MALSPEKKAALKAKIAAAVAEIEAAKLPPAPPPRPKLVTAYGEPIGEDGDVPQPVGRGRFDRVTINMAEAERRYWDRQHDQARDSQQRREADPFGMGHWDRGSR